MKPQDIHLRDWMRILVREVPPAYFIEIVLRIGFVFILLPVAMRLMGKRMAGQLNRNDLAAQVSLVVAIEVVNTFGVYPLSRIINHLMMSGLSKKYTFSVRL